MRNLISLIATKCRPVDFKRGEICTFLNPYSYVKARKKSDLFNQFDNLQIDGILLVKMLRFFGILNISRQSFDMTSLATRVFDFATTNNKSICIIGSTKKNLELAIKNIKNLYPHLNLIFARHGYFSNDEERNDVIKEIVSYNPDIVIVSMGAILQEEFLIDLRKFGWKKLGFTSGGFVHQTAKALYYYPEWINKGNFRAVFRFLKEPRLGKRYFLIYPLFVLLFIWDYFQYVKSTFTMQ